MHRLLLAHALQECPPDENACSVMEHLFPGSTCTPKCGGASAEYTVQLPFDIDSIDFIFDFQPCNSDPRASFQIKDGTGVLSDTYGPYEYGDEEDIALPPPFSWGIDVPVVGKVSLGLDVEFIINGYAPLPTPSLPCLPGAWCAAAVPSKARAL